MKNLGKGFFNKVNWERWTRRPADRLSNEDYDFKELMLAIGLVAFLFVIIVSYIGHTV